MKTLFKSKSIFLIALALIIAWSGNCFGKIPVYRLYNTVSKTHLYSADANEKYVLEADSDWNYEGVAWYGYESDVGQNPVYRLYSPILGKHLFTTDENEKNVLDTGPNWQFEKIAWYADATPDSGDIPIYRLYSDVLKQHLYTADVNEKNTLDGNGVWVYEGIAYYASANWKSPSETVKVMTRNLYLGADIFKVLEASQNPDPALGGLDIPIAVAEMFQTVQYTNFPERAEAIADEIFLLKPHLIGLQEVSQWFIQSPSDFFAPFPPDVNPDQQPADVVVYDFLQILLDALAARGLNYQVAVSSVDNADVELPMLTGFTTITGYPDPIPTFDDVRLVDRDVILVRGDVETFNSAMASYGNNMSTSIGGTDLEFTRGWVAVDAHIDDEVYRFVNTHLEIDGSPYSVFRVIQSAQMQELLTILKAETKQIILAGDFNSSPEDVPGLGFLPENLDVNGNPYNLDDGISYMPPYMLAKNYFRYSDAWDLLLSPKDGFSYGFNETVNDLNTQMTSRIDLIFLSQIEKIKEVFGIRTGVHDFSITPAGLWPSDHAGVFTEIVFEN